ncbi:acidic amino acid decarboxylase GADL1-like [Macrobrachium nipponense]|uniref:acidic amino acid decarboxylase GADL1-like n=1 Tax=Macrobrachium nipponense TaxID=159736 RepID=UPI0030C888EA
MECDDTTESSCKLLEKVLDLVQKEHLVAGADRNKKLVEFKHPRELQSLLALNIGQEGKTEEEVKKILEDVVKYSVRTGHPYFYNQLYAGVDEIGVAGSWLSTALNTNQYTFEVAPVFSLVEHHVISTLVKLFGFEDGDGIFSPGGSMNNMYGMQLARYRLFKDGKTEGIFGRKPMVALTSDQSHYSIKKAANWMGIGINNVVIVATDRFGRMIPQALKQAISVTRENGKEPFFVNATAGTTVLGSFDPIKEIADVCEKEKLWLHVDGCWGGTAILSKKHKHNLAGIERADSISWNPHKMLGAPLQCSAFVVKHKGLLHECNSASATYLFQQDKFYDTSFDTGDKSFQCGRKVDAFKFYMFLTTHGLNELERRVDAAFSASLYLNKKLKSREGFRPVLEEPQCTNVCFWYIPPRLRKETESPEWWEKIAKIAPQLKERMVTSGVMMIGYQPIPIKNLCNFIRMVNCCYPTPTEEDMDHVLDTIDALGEDL